MVNYFDEYGIFEEECMEPDSPLEAIKKLIQKRFGPIQISHHEKHADSDSAKPHTIGSISILDGNEQQYTGKGKDPNADISILRALVDAVNQAYIDKHYKSSKQQAIYK